MVYNDNTFKNEKRTPSPIANSHGTEYLCTEERMCDGCQFLFTASAPPPKLLTAMGLITCVLRGECVMAASSCSLLVVLRGVPVSRCPPVGVGVTSTSTGSMEICTGGSTTWKMSMQKNGIL